MLSLKKQPGVVTSTGQTVALWRFNIPRVTKTPVEVELPRVEIDLKDSFYKASSDSFITCDNNEIDIGLTRLTGMSGKQCTYSTYFYPFGAINRGYYHCISFKTESPIDEITASSEGSFFVIITMKKNLHMISTDSGEPIYDFSPPWSCISPGYELAIPSDPTGMLTILDTRYEVWVIDLKNENVKKRFPLPESLVKKHNVGPKIAWAEQNVFAVSCDAFIQFIET